MDVILVPGLWLDASSWTDVAARLVAAGHRAQPLTLRGLESRSSNRQGMMLAEHVAEIGDVIDRGRAPVVLVGHAEACGLVHAAVNRRPQRIARVIHVGGFPSADGTRMLSASAIDFRAQPVDVIVRDTTDPVLEDRYRRIAENGAERFDPVQWLTDERRYSVPSTIVATEYRVDDVRRWVRAGVDLTRELRRMTDLTLVDLPSGPVPQQERPDDLAHLILDEIERPPMFPDGPTSIEAFASTVGA